MTYMLYDSSSVKISHERQIAYEFVEKLIYTVTIERLKNIQKQ